MSEERFHYFIHKLLGEKIPTTGITTKSLDTMDKIVHFLIRETSRVINELMFISKRKTVSSREVQYALYILIKDDKLQKIACGGGLKAITSYRNFEKEGKTMSTEMAHITISVPRVQKAMMSLCLCSRKSRSSGVYLAGAIQGVLLHILHKCSDISIVYRKKRITQKHVILAIKGDKNLNKIFKSMLLSGGITSNEMFIPRSK